MTGEQAMGPTLSCKDTNVLSPLLTSKVRLAGPYSLIAVEIQDGASVHYRISYLRIILINVIDITKETNYHWRRG